MDELEKDVNQIENLEEKKEDEKQSDAPVLTEEEKEAVTKGWKPKEKWIEEGGSEDDWKPAKVFNEIGHLKERLNLSEQEKKKLNKVVQIMKEHHINVRQSAYEQAVKDIKAQRAAALEEQDFAKAEKLRDQMDDLRDRFQKDDKLPKEIEAKVQQEAGEPDPEFFRFLDRNPWYKPHSKDEMSRKADALGFAYAQEDPNADFKTIISKVEADIKRLYPEKFQTNRTPVNEPGSRGSPASSKDKVSLSEIELQVAREFGMTPEEYAKQQSTYKRVQKW